MNARTVVKPYDRPLLNNKKKCSADILHIMDESQHNYSGKSQTKREAYYTLPFIRHDGKGKTTELKIDHWLPAVGGNGRN